MNYDVFISYSRKDTAVADRICAAFDEAGITYFIDRKGIGGGMEFPRVLAEAILGCRKFLFLASANSYVSKFTNSEITFAFNKKDKDSILPYRIDTSEIPIELEFVFCNINWRNIEEHPVETVLVRDILQMLGRPTVTPSAVKTPSRPAVPTPAATTPATTTPIAEKSVDGFEMVYVAGGTFTMGASDSDSEADGDEKPAHSVTLSGYYIGKYEVTQKQWVEIMGSNPSEFKGDNLPVEKVSWYDAQEFIGRLNSRTGKNYRLPTEAEWEFAARGGNSSRGYKYSGSDNPDAVAWYEDNSGEETHAVGTKSPNELDIYDMSGNVWEWCQDWKDSYSSSAQINHQGPSDGTDRVLRGGSWYYGAEGSRISYRYYAAPDHRGSSGGFRLALSE